MDAYQWPLHSTAILQRRSGALHWKVYGRCWGRWRSSGVVVQCLEDCVSEYWSLQCCCTPCHAAPLFSHLSCCSYWPTCGKLDGLPRLIRWHALNRKGQDTVSSLSYLFRGDTLENFVHAYLLCYQLALSWCSATADSHYSTTNPQRTGGPAGQTNVSGIFYALPGRVKPFIHQPSFVVYLVRSRTVSSMTHPV